MTNASDPDPGETPTLRWDFSDGASTAGAAADHAFGVPGEATATAVAIDPAGVASSQTLKIDIPPAGAGGGAGTGGGTSGAGGPGATSGAGGPVKPSRASELRVGKPRLGRNGRVRVPVTCVGPTRCEGTLVLHAKKGKKRVTLGRTRFSVKAGAHRTLVVKLSKRARAAWPKGRRVCMLATAAGLDGGHRVLEAVGTSAVVRVR